MEVLLTNNIFFVYLLGILVIINYEVFEKKQKIAIIYACSFGLTFNHDLRCSMIILLLLLILFVYEEYLNEDLVKVQYITKFKYKIADFLYMYIFQYKLLYVVLAIGLKSQTGRILMLKIFSKSSILKDSMENVLTILPILLMIVGIHKIFTNPVELKNFTQINQKFSTYPYYRLPLSDNEKRNDLLKKLELIADIEDHTFFERKRSYNFCSLEFVKSVFERKQRVQAEKRAGRTLTIKVIWYFIRRKNKLQLLKRGISKVWRKMKGKLSIYMRGYSTIEMQLIRILSYKKGLKLGKPRNLEELYLVLTRKIYEVVYSTIFFSSHKKYLNVSKKKDYYKHYLIYIYLHTVQTNLNGRVFAPLDKIFGKVDIMKWPIEAIFIIALGLNSRRITRDRINVYMNLVYKYDLDTEVIYQLVESLR